MDARFSCILGATVFAVFTSLTCPLEVGAQRGRDAAASITVRLERIPLPELIGDPAYFVGDASGFALVDYSTMTIYRSDAAGKWLDSLRAVGSGPGEFREISGVAFDAKGNIWIADGANARLSQLRRDLSVVRSISTELPLRSFAATDGGRQFVSLPASVQDLAVIVTENGRVLRRVGFASREESLNPIIRERFISRVNDSLAIIQFRWFDRRIGLTGSGGIAYAAGEQARLPEVLTIPLNRSGTSTAFRVDPGTIPFALSTTVQGDQFMVLRGGIGEREGGRVISVYDAESGALKHSYVLPQAVVKIAANSKVLLAIAESADGYAMYRVVRSP